MSANEERTVESYFGLCPKCHGNDAFLNVNRQHWMVCHRHKTRWCVGSNLFSNAAHETAADWAQNKAILAGYKVVDPVFPVAA